MAEARDSGKGGEMVEIGDQASAEAWLEGKPRQVASVFVTRWVLRLLPMIATHNDSTTRYLSLTGVRALQVSACAATVSGDHSDFPQLAAAAKAISDARPVALEAAVDASPSPIDSDDRISDGVAFAAAGDTAAAAELAAMAATSDAVFLTSASALARVRISDATEWNAASKDAAWLDGADDPAGLFATPLWPDGMPEGVRGAYETLQAFWNRDPETWGFWARWYEGMLNGAPLDWELQRAVALIADEVWDDGPEAVAARIAEIESRFALQARIAELEVELARASRDRHGIGGNFPPEPIADAPQIAREFSIIWVPLQDLKEETGKPEPNRALVRRALDALIAALRTGVEWAAAKADLAVDTAIKWGIPAAGGGYMAMNPDKLEAVIAAAQRWLSLLF